MLSIAAKGSYGVFAECPRCHRSIPHGFQICNHCGHGVTADQQQALRQRLATHFFGYLLMAGSMIILVVLAANQWLV
ncbi:hypothetical protein [Oceanicoccus sagamiensis]|uniref:Zinc ribbon domain-containing protein n=1 Tax=Oceanicoccus sagamiensis TaxID=716816 RepID=A0A1X9NIY8_9GAMM|nr:hypothetical protein [Oceanicoccus sagamiensis]ARN73953.1 hypothetical protein BST96_07380 [Oceanicoccus sagamiensis]